MCLEANRPETRTATESKAKEATLGSDEKNQIDTLAEYLIKNWPHRITAEGNVTDVTMQILESFRDEVDEAEDMFDDDALTIGEEIIGTHNPSGREDVDSIENAAAHFINVLDDYFDFDHHLVSVAIDNILTAQMFAVKAATSEQ